MTAGRFFCSTSAVAVILALAGPAVAQDAADTTAGNREVEEIIVTAQRREQSLQDVPIVVTSVSGQLLQDAGVRDIKDLTVLTPGLMVTSTTNESVTSARIRGVGTVGDNPGLESSVGILIDGVYRPRNGVGFGDLGETQRIEVLKGPQGTLFGKNTSAGVINIITKSPEFDFGATSEAVIGNHGQAGFSTSITGPFSDTLAGRLYVAARARDGFQDTMTAFGPRPGDDGNQNFYTGRGQLLWKSGPLSARIVADYTKRDEDCCLGVNVVNGPFSAVVNGVGALTGRGPGVLSPADPEQRLTFANRGTLQKIEDKGVQAEVNWDLGGMALTSVTAVREWDILNSQDIDFTTLDILYRDANGGYFRKFNQISQELRLAGETEKAVWLVGGFFSKERLKSGEQQIQGSQLELYLDQMFRAASAPGTQVQLRGIAAITGRPLGANAPPGVSQDDRYKQVSDSYAAFANVSYKLTEALELTGGIRFTSERKDVDSYYANGPAVVSSNGAGGACSLLAINTAAVLAGSLTAPNATLARLYAGYYCRPGADSAYNNLVTRQESKEDKFSGTAKAAYRFSPDLMTYVSYARGYKGGGFNLDRVRVQTVATNPSGIGLPLTDTSFAPEYVDSYELGAKTSWFGRSVLFNAALFYQKYENFQLNGFDGIGFTVTSIPKVVSRGVDADLIWRTPLDGLSIQSGVTYAETQYADARPASPSFALPSAANPTGGGLYRLPGSRVSFAPLWSGSVSGTYEQDIGALLMRANVTAKYTSTYNTGSDLLPSKTQGELTLVNARLGLSSADERWTVEVWGQNLFDKTYFQVAYDGPLQPNQVNAFLGAPRTLGATLRFRY